MNAATYRRCNVGNRPTLPGIALCSKRLLHQAGMSLAADTVLSVATRLNTTSHNGRIGPRDNVPVTPNRNVSTGDDDLIQLAWQEECDLTRVSELFRKDLGTKDSSKVPTGSRHSSERDDADIDKILSDELEKLTVDEREQIAYDVHGLLRNSQSDPLDIDFRLAELEQEIRKVRNRKDYEKAKYLNESFVSDRSFRLMFLRCDQFNVQIAAQRIVKHFEIKRELFGDKCLARTLRMSDLNEDDMEVLNSGLFHLQPTRDVAGRLVMVFDPGLRPDIPITNIVSSCWEDDEESTIINLLFSQNVFSIVARDRCEQLGFCLTISLATKAINNRVLW